MNLLLLMIDSGIDQIDMEGLLKMFAKFKLDEND